MRSVEARALPCPNCGGAVPVMAAETAQCLYCLSPVPVPQTFSRPLAEHQELGARLHASMKEVARARRFAFSSPALAAGYGLFILALVAPVVGAQLLDFEKLAKYPGGLLNVLIPIVVYGAIVLAAFVGALSSAMSTARRLARLPLVTLRVDGDLAVSCPRCGAPASPDAGDLTLRCGHCSTQSLLPAVLVSSRLQQKHKRIMTLHKRAREVNTEAGHADDVGKRSGGYILLGAGMLLLVGYIVYWQVEPMPAHLRGATRVVLSFLPGVMLSLPMFFLAYALLRRSD